MNLAPKANHSVSYPWLGTGGEACGYQLPEREVFKHLWELPQHEERRNTNG
jgi:hypothetical protein